MALLESELKASEEYIARELGIAVADRRVFRRRCCSGEALTSSQPDS
jgi:hypothetical protein